MAGRYLRLHTLMLFGILLMLGCETVGKEYPLAGGGEIYTREIVTEPSDAEISVDGTPIGKTPITLSITAPRYLVKAAGPADAEAMRDPFENLRERGSVPPPYDSDPSYVEYRDALQQPHVLTIRKSGYENITITFAMEDMQEKIPEIISLLKPLPPVDEKSSRDEHEQQMEPDGDSEEERGDASDAIQYGFLTITSEPPRAEVFVGNKLIGTTPLTRIILEPGLYQLVLRHPEVKDWTYQVEILPRSTTTLHAHMEK